MDKKYWEGYYKSGEVPEEPSLFARFVLEEGYIKEEDSLLELGCGNGRDSVFFARNNLQVLAIDQCKEEIIALLKKYSADNLNFLCDDFTRLGEIGIFDNIYSRFTMHSITETEEERVLDWVYKHLNKRGNFLIEARGHKNELYSLGEAVPGDFDAFVFEGHYRRFIDLEKFEEKLKTKGFRIISAEEKQGFAPYKETDYFFIRVLAQK